MAADVLKYSIGNASSTTLSSSITGSDTSAPLTSDTNFAAKSGEGMALIDEGLASEEIAYSTGKSGASLTIPLANRGLEGGSAQAHSSGASVKGIFTAGMWNDLIDALSLIVDKTTGLVKAGIAFTSPKVITGINDTNNNELIKVTATASAVNEFTVANAATGNSPTISATGGDTDIDINITPKGTGRIKSATVAVPTISSTDTLTNKRITKRVVTTTDDASAVIDVDVTDDYQLSAVANATEFTLTGTPTDGQVLIVRYKDAGVSKALTWTGFTAIGTTLPTATTAGKWGYVGCKYNSAASQWHVLAVQTQA